MGTAQKIYHRVIFPTKISASQYVYTAVLMFIIEKT